jgi:glycine/D-amino acid oxidase-like deaminating enzyme/nitrite reductase/ring-hydroxylating ferredoxin subunit
MDTTSYWSATTSFPQFPELKRDCEVDIAIIGAGVTGITAAYLFKQRGYKVALLERGHCGGFDSLNTTAHLTYVTDTRLHELVKTFGEQQAKAVWEAGLKAIRVISDNIRKEGIACEFRWVAGYLHAAKKAPSAKELRLLQQDADYATSFGFPAEYPAEAPGFALPGIRFSKVAKFHPGKYLQALVRTIPGKGSFVFENTEVTRVQKDPVEVKVGKLRVRCKFIVLATHNPLVGNARLISATLLQTKLSLYNTYAVGAQIPKGIWTEASYWDTAEPYNYLRIDRRPGSDYAIYGGGDHKTGQAQNTVEVYRRLEKKLLRLIPEAKVDHRWSGQVIETVDGLPYMGCTGPHQFAATGFSGNGYTFGTLAATMAVDTFEDRANPWSDLFDIRRKKIQGAAWTYLKENKDFPYHFIHDRLERAESKSLKTVAANEGKILRLRGRKAAAYRDPKGNLTVCSPVCTHLKCIVAWNAAEKTWDCPCHGSRFAPTGEVLSGPAEAPLEPFFKPEDES